MEKTVNIEGTNKQIRDLNSKAILNNSLSDLEAYKQRKKQKAYVKEILEQHAQEIKKLKEEIINIRSHIDNHQY